MKILGTWKMSGTVSSRKFKRDSKGKLKRQTNSRKKSIIPLLIKSIN
jgi:hypothetical protein